MSRIGRILKRQWPLILVLVGLTGVICMILWLAAQAADNSDDIAALRRELDTVAAQKDATADALGAANADRVAAGQDPIVPAPVQGVPGPAGVGISSVTRDPQTCVLTVTLTEGPVVDLGDVCGAPGADGKPGADGRGIADVRVDGCTLVVTYTDDTTQNAGSVCAAGSAPGGPGSGTSGEENS